MEQFNITMRKYLKEVGVTSQQAIERTVLSFQALYLEKF
jgi:hypothetical protein